MKEKGRQMMCFKKKKDGNGMVPTVTNAKMDLIKEYNATSAKFSS